MTEIFILCVLFFLICYCNTGTDEKNIKSFSSYPDEIQHVVRENASLYARIKTTAPLIAFISNIVVFTGLLFVFGLFIKNTNFSDNFTNLLILGESLNLFDFLVIDMLWWRNSTRIRFTGTEPMDQVYRNPKKHFISFIKGVLVFFIVAMIDGLLLSLF